MSDHSLPPNVRTGIDSPVRETRLTGVDELARLALGTDLALAAAARRELTRLTGDDSRSVASAATAALEFTSIRLNPALVDFGAVPPATPRLIADVLVEGPPLAVAGASVSISGPGLRAELAGRRLRVIWVPRSYWLDGLITVTGPAGWADVQVTGRIDANAPMPVAAVRPPPALEPADPAPPRRRKKTRLLVAGVAAVLLLAGGGVGAAMAMSRDKQQEPPVSAALPGPQPTTATATTAAPPVPREPVAARVASLGKPVVTSTIKVGTEPEGVAVAPDGRTVYVANQNSRVLSVVDSRSRKVTQVKLRNTPRFVATSRDGSLVFVSMYENDKSGSGVAVVDAADRSVHYLSTGVQPYTLAVAPDGRLWVPIHSEHRVEVYTAAGQRPDGRVDVPPNPHAVAFSAGLLRAFTPNHESNEVGVIDMRTDELLKTIPVSKAPHSIAVSPDGRTVLVAGYDADTADLIDANTLRRSGPFPVGSKPQCVAFATDGKHAYVVNEGDNTVSVLDSRTGAVTSTVKVGRSPRSIAVAPDGLRAYVSNGDDDTVTVLQVGR